MTTESMRNVVEDLAVHADITVHRSDGEPADPSEFHPHALRHSLSNYMLGDSVIPRIFGSWTYGTGFGTAVYRRQNAFTTISSGAEFYWGIQLQETGQWQHW
ncbi:hypothetical protein ACFQL4_26250 [Halosimplex aquaticum]